eukprot:550784-Pleurochrysis_carterae.AAC.1
MNVPSTATVYNEVNEALSVSQVSAPARRVSADASGGHGARTRGKRRRYATVHLRTLRGALAYRRCRRRARRRVVRDELRNALSALSASRPPLIAACDARTVARQAIEAIAEYAGLKSRQDACETRVGFEISGKFRIRWPRSQYV